MLERPTTTEEIERILHRVQSAQELKPRVYSDDEVADLCALFYRIKPEWLDGHAG